MIEKTIKRKHSHKHIKENNKAKSKGEILACTRKVKRSKAEAKAYAYRHGLWFYKCPYCGKYHITSQRHYDNNEDLYERIAKMIVGALING